MPVATVLPPLGDSPSALPPAVATRLLVLGGPPSVPPPPGATRALGGPPSAPLPLPPLVGLEGAGNSADSAGRAAGHRGRYSWRITSRYGGKEGGG